MDTWTMISVTYSRLPNTTNYKADVKIDWVVKDREKLEVVKRRGYLADEVTMENLIKYLHQILQEEPGPHKVTMLRQIPATKWTEGHQRGFELDEKMVNTIKNDLPEALRMFAPVTQTCDVRPWVPTLAKEN